MEKQSERVLYAGKWLTLKESLYRNERGEEVRWESIDRSGSRDVVVVVARLLPSERFVLIRQFRPAVNNYVIGFPAGVLDAGTAEESVLRELREETGYAGVVRKIGPSLLSNSALLSDRVRLAYVEVDEAAPENQAPTQELEPSEEIEVMLVPQDDVRAFLLERQRAGDDIGSGPWYLLGFWDSFGLD
jgi:ADP-ribose pyrophosphatase